MTNGKFAKWIRNDEEKWNYNSFVEFLIFLNNTHYVEVWIMLTPMKHQTCICRVDNNIKNMS